MRAMTRRLTTLRLPLALVAMLAYVALSVIMSAQQPVRADVPLFVTADICGDPDSDAHCPFCALAHAVALPTVPDVPGARLRLLAGATPRASFPLEPVRHAPCPEARAPPLAMI